MPRSSSDGDERHLTVVETYITIRTTTFEPSHLPAVHFSSTRGLFILRGDAYFLTMWESPIDSETSTKKKHQIVSCMPEDPHPIFFADDTPPSISGRMRAELGPKASLSAVVYSDPNPLPFSTSCSKQMRLLFVASIFLASKHCKVLKAALGVMRKMKSSYTLESLRIKQSKWSLKFVVVEERSKWTVSYLK